MFLNNVCRAASVSYLQQRSSRKQVEVHVESQDRQSDGRDVVQAHLKQLGGQEQQAQMGPPLSGLHTENHLGGDNHKD